MLKSGGRTERHRIRSATAAGVVVATAGLFVGCASRSQRGTVVRIGAITIKRDTIAHWTGVRHVVPLPGASAKQQALEFLISAAWLTGEAAERGVKVSRAEVKAALAARERWYSSRTEFHEALRSLGYTLSDVELELRADLTSNKLRQSAVDGDQKVSSSEIKSYYTKHIREFDIPEERYFDIVEFPKTLSQARKFMREVAAGRSVTEAASLHESYRRKPFSDYAGEKRIIYEAIFKAHLHVLSKPIPEYRHYWLFEINRIVPPHVQSLASETASIEHKLAGGRRRRSLARFVAQWRKKWLARTECQPGFVVQKCKEFKGDRRGEDTLAFN
jgi:foldase protein PrsA